MTKLSNAIALAALALSAATCVAQTTHELKASPTTVSRGSVLRNASLAVGISQERPSCSGTFAPIVVVPSNAIGSTPIKAS